MKHQQIEETIFQTLVILIMVIIFGVIGFLLEYVWSQFLFYVLALTLIYYSGKLIIIKQNL
ncbi:MAG: hypothetical protein ACLFPL_01140 [Candidatus Nanoarchaeia archaeon]